MTSIEKRLLLEEFLERWSIENISKMTLQEYVGIQNQDTFCQWVETQTRALGSIKGMTSIKFGIYERDNKNEYPQNYNNDDVYSWLKGYGENRDVAFKKVKEDIINIIKFSMAGKFHLLNDILLPDLFKWKIAFLYSNERLIPIYKKDTLNKIAAHFGTKSTNKSDIQNIMIENKPAHLDVFQYSGVLWEQFGEKEGEKNKKNDIDEHQNSTKAIKESVKKNYRKESAEKNIENQIRTFEKRNYIAQQQHNRIQESLKLKLINEYGIENVKIEENYVDIKVYQPDFINFYEVKSDTYAAECIKKALGQLISYSFKDNDKRQKKLFVVGQYPPNEDDKKYIEYLKTIIRLEIDYITVDNE